MVMVGNSTVGEKTDLLIVRESATFELAPKLVVVRETNCTDSGNSSVDKIHKVPRTVSKADIEAILAFFEVAVVEHLSGPTMPLASQAPAPPPTPPSPHMPG